METAAQKKNRRRRGKKANKTQSVQSSPPTSRSRLWPREARTLCVDPSLPPSSPTGSTATSHTSSAVLSAPDTVRVEQPRVGDMVLRPGYGSLGHEIEVYANVFKLQYNPQLQVHQYNVDIQSFTPPSRGGRGRGRGRGRGGRAPAGPPRILREEIRAAMQQFFSNGRLPTGASYDGQSNVYVPGNQISPIVDQVTISMEGERKMFTVSIAYAATITLTDVRSFLSKQSVEYPSTATSALDVAMRHVAAMKINNFVINRAIFGIQPNARLIGPGVQAVSGYTQSSRPCQLGLTLNMNACFSPMIKEETVASFVASYASCKKRVQIPPEQAHQVIDNDMYKRMAAKLNKLKAKTVHNPRKEQHFKLAGFTENSAHQTFFTDANGQRISVAEHFHRAYGIRLRYPNLRLVKFYKGKKIDEKHAFPPECVMIHRVPFKRELSDLEREYLIKAATQNPDEKKAYIEKELTNQLREPAQVRHLDAWGLKVNPQMEIVPARVLPAPSLEGGGEGKIDVEGKGHWDVQKFHEPATLQSWALVNFCHPDELPLKSFFEQLIASLKSRGMNVPDGFPYKKDAHRSQMFRACGIMKEAAEGAKTKFNKDCQLIVAIMPQFHTIKGTVEESTETLRIEIKIASDQLLGIPSQCINAVNAGLMARDARNFNAYLTQIGQKINAKLGGHTAILYDRPVGNPSCIFPKLGRSPFMVLGVDLTHPPPRAVDKRSVAGIVASMNNTLTKYACRLQFQQQDLSTGREVLHDLKRAVQELLLEYYRQNNGIKPEAILMYRDGVSQGEYAKVIEHEFKAIREACSEMGDKSADYCPPITFIIVQKRHHMRFIPKDPRDAEASGNIPPGLCVDRHVCHPQGFDFYLNSHAGIQGTSRPSLYSVLVDQVGFNADELQLLTYWMCHLYCRCTRSVSYCPPAYYAHLAAERGKLLLFHQSRNVEKVVHHDVENTMFFV